MRPLGIAVLFVTIPLLAGDSGFNGRWVIEPLSKDAKRVMWLEVHGADAGQISGSVVGGGPGGQLDPIVRPRLVAGKLSFWVDRHTGQGEKRRLVKTMTETTLKGDELQGVTHFERRDVRWVGRRAPTISDRDDGSWKKGEPIALFDGRDLSRWATQTPGRESEWYVEDGVMKNHDHADLLVSKRKFWNFQLDAEYRVLPEMNGGIGLRGRYEIQILDDYGKLPYKSGNGALYSRVPPSVNASKPAGEWQRFSITLIGRDLSVVLNGKKIHDKTLVEGFTAMATDWREDQPGPITLQGDHGAVEFRKIILTPLTK